MIIDFTTIQEEERPHFQGGEKSYFAKMYADDQNKIMSGRLEPGASIGIHTHVTNSEMIYVLEGTGTVLYNDGSEKVGPGTCHYCPMGYSHSLINDGMETLRFLAIVPSHAQ